MSNLLHPPNNSGTDANPYEAPRESSTDTQRIFWTQKRVFLTGVGAIFLALFCWLVLKLLEAKQGAGIFVITTLSSITFAVGAILMVASHWFPHPNRKYSWRKTNGKHYPWD